MAGYNNPMDNTPTRGALPSPFDYRDNVAAASAIATLATVQLPNSIHTDVGPVMNQAQEPACVSFMVAELMKAWWYKKTGQWVDFSPRFFDILVKRFDNLNRATDGTYGRLAISLAAVYGCPTTATLPNDTTLPILSYRDDSLLTPAVFAEAQKYKIPGYIQIPTDMQSTRAAIVLYGAVGSLKYVDQNLWTPSWKASDLVPLRTPNPNKQFDEGHAMTTVGYGSVITSLNTDRNHWSDLWANAGEADFDAKAWAPFIMEQWAISEIPSDIKSFLGTLPSPTAFHFTWNTNLCYGMQVVGTIDFSGIVHGTGRYATDPNYAAEISAIYSQILTASPILTPSVLDGLIAGAVGKGAASPITGAMIFQSAVANGITPGILAAVLQHESCYGTLGAGAHTHNPGNVGNVDSGATQDLGTWQAGVEACAVQLARRQMLGGTDDVREAQVALMILGYLLPLAPNEFGMYGPKTATAVANYQKGNRITPSPNNIGPQTRAALNAQFAVGFMGDTK